MSNLRAESVQAHDREIDRLESLIAEGHWLLRFPRDLESHFVAEYSQRFLAYRQRTVLLSLLVLMTAGVLDQMLVHNDFGSVMLLRYGMMTPLAFGLLVFSRTRFFPAWQQVSLSAYTLMLAVFVLGLLYLGDDRTLLVYSSGLMLVAMFAGTLLYLRFWLALILLVVIGMMYAAFILDVRPQGGEIVWILLIFYALASVGALLGSYRAEHAARRQFLHSRLLELKQNELELANHQLQELVDQDGLTGIANRRHFDRQLLVEWNRAARGGYPVSLLMIDLDFFKKYNDTYGHQAGDDCLIVIGAVLRAHSQRSGDVAARYGGEEFAMILPSTDCVDAEEIGWRLVRDLESYGIPHRASAVAEVVTASVGVACMVPTPLSSPRELLGMADEALYEAKKQGRNRVVVAPGSALVRVQPVADAGGQSS